MFWAKGQPKFGFPQYLAENLGLDSFLRHNSHHIFIFNWITKCALNCWLGWFNKLLLFLHYLHTYVLFISCTAWREGKFTLTSLNIIPLNKRSTKHYNKNYSVFVRSWTHNGFYSSLLAVKYLSCIRYEIKIWKM